MGNALFDFDTTFDGWLICLHRSPYSYCTFGELESHNSDERREREKKTDFVRSEWVSLDSHKSDKCTLARSSGDETRRSCIIHFSHKCLNYCHFCHWTSSQMRIDIIFAVDSHIYWHPWAIRCALKCRENAKFNRHEVVAMPHVCVIRICVCVFYFSVHRSIK